MTCTSPVPTTFLRTPAEIIQANLADIGITTNIVAEDWTVYLPKVLEGDFTTTILGNSGLADPDDYLYNVFHTGSSDNFSNFSNPDIDALLEQGRQASDPDERKAILQRGAGTHFRAGTARVLVSLGAVRSVT